MTEQEKRVNCLFCQIVKKELQSWIVHENEEITIFLDITPLAKGHCLVVTKKCHKNLLTLNEKELLAIQRGAQMMVAKLTKTFQPQGFNLINNFNRIAGQVVDHYHLHIIPKYEQQYGFSWKKNIKNDNQDLKLVWRELKK